MGQLAKFSKKAIIVYGCQQVAEGTSVNQDSPSGSITTTVGSANVTGVGTSFTTQVAVGAYLYTTTDAIIGRVKTVTDNTHIVLYDVVPGSATSQSAGVQAVATAVTGVAFKVGLGPQNALAGLNANFSIENDTEEFQFVGDELSRDVATVLKDTYGKLDFETIMPVRGATAGSDPVESELPFADWFQSCGFAIVLSTGGADYWTATNSVSSNAYMTIEVRLSSPDLNNSQKTYILTDARGNIDLDAVIGAKPKLKFNYQGNLGTIAQKFALVADFQSVKTDLSPTFKSTTIGLSALDLYSGSVEPSPSGSSNVCFDKLNAPNVTGFEYNRYQTGCLDGWSKTAVPTDVDITVLEDSAAATYNPTDNIEALHRLTIRYGDTAALSTAGQRIEIVFHKLRLANVVRSEVADYFGLDLKFRNAGTTDIKFY